MLILTILAIISGCAGYSGYPQQQYCYPQQQYYLCPQQQYYPQYYPPMNFSIQGENYYYDSQSGFQFAGEDYWYGGGGLGGMSFDVDGNTIYIGN